MRITIASVLLSALGAASGCGNLRDAYTGAEHVGYTPDGTLVVYTPAGIKLYDTLGRHESRSIQLARAAGTVDVPFTFDLSRDGRVAAVSYSNTAHKDIQLFAIPGGDLLTTIDVDMPPQWAGIPVQNITVSPGADLVYVRGPAPGVYATADGTRLWNDDSGLGDDLGLEPVTFSNDGGTLYGIAGANLRAFDARTGALRYSVATGGPIAALRLLADGSRLVGVRIGDCYPTTTAPCPIDPGSVAQAYVFWSASDGAPAGEVAQFAGYGAAHGFPSGVPLACSNTGSPCASGAGDGQRPFVLIWNADGTLIQALATGPAPSGPDGSTPGGPIGPAVNPVNGLAFSPDGNELAVVDGKARVYRVSDGALISERSYDYGVF